MTEFIVLTTVSYYSQKASHYKIESKQNPDKALTEQLP